MESYKPYFVTVKFINNDYLKTRLNACNIKEIEDHYKNYIHEYYEDTEYSNVTYPYKLEIEELETKKEYEIYL